MPNDDISPDAQRFLIVEADLSGKVESFEVILDWTSQWTESESP
jgi:hypothetical protein